MNGKIFVVKECEYYDVATLFSSFLMARLMKSLIVVPVEATKAATRECSSDDILRFNFPL